MLFHISSVRSTERIISAAIRNLLLFLLIWALFALFYNRAAVRFTLFLAPPAVILGAYAIMFILKRSVSYDESRISNLVMLICFMVLAWQLRLPCLAFLTNIGLDRIVSSLVCANLIVLSAVFVLLRGNQVFSTEEKNPVIAKVKCLTLSIALCIITGGIPYFLPSWISQKTIGHIPTPNEIKAFNWLKTNTSTKSVIAAWWEHGSRIGASCRAQQRLVDQQHNPPRIRSMAHEVFCAETPENALKFLKSHKATHLLIRPMDVFDRLEYISAIGSPQNTVPNVLTERFRIG